MSNIFLAFDTETTGFPSSKKSLTDKTQPHLVSCSALQFTSSGYIMQSMSRMVQPQGWDWDESNPAFKVHQLTTEQCSTFGASEKEVIDNLLQLWFIAPEPAILLAHNSKFDRDIIAIAIARHYPGEATLLKTWVETPGVCTQRTNKEAVGAKTVKGAAKMPNLAETYKHFIGEDLENRHSANADAVAVYQIHMAMQQRESQ